MERTGDRAPECVGLRERKKIATREALSHVAIQLALRDGPENVRVPDIVAEVGVSPRTFNNYFSSIAEAICAPAAEQMLRIGDTLRRRSAGEPLAEAIANALIEDHDGTEEHRRIVQMIMNSPLLRGELFKSVMVREHLFAAAIAERVQAPEGDLNAQLLAAAYFGMARVIGHRWLCEGDVDFRGLLRTGLDLLAPAAAAYQASLTTAQHLTSDEPADRGSAQHAA